MPKVGSLTAAAVLVLSVAACGTGARSTSPSVRLTSNAAKPPAPLRPGGPAAGRLVLAWSTSSPDAGPDAVALAATAGEVLTANRSGPVTAYNARTGSLRWRATISGGVAAVAVSGSVIVVDQAATQEWAGLDAASGRLLWQRPRLGSMLVLGGRVLAPATDGVVPAMAAGGAGAGPRVVGVDARHGTIRWRLDRASLGGCLADTRPLTRGAGIGTRLMVFGARCGARTDLVAFDMLAARVSWRLVVPSEVSAAHYSIGRDSLAGVGGTGFVALVYESGHGGGSVVLGPDGHPIATVPGVLPVRAPGIQPLQVAGGRALIEVTTLDARVGFSLIDLRARKARWISGTRAGLLSSSGAPSPLAFDGRTLYALDRSTAVTATNVATGTSRTLQLPGASTDPTSSWIGAAGGYLFVAAPGLGATGGTGLVAYQRTGDKP